MFKWNFAMGRRPAGVTSLLTSFVCERDPCKDYAEEIDFQEPFFAVVNWAISEFYGAIVCIMHYFDQSATIQLANVFLIAGCGFL